MAIKITEECINCGACGIKCPNKAIYEPGQQWSFESANTNSRFRLNNGNVVPGNELQQPVSKDVYYIVTEKCTECVGFHNEPQCISVCPIDCCIPDEAHYESKDALATKKQRIQVE